MIDPTLITSVDPPPGGDHLNIQISPCGTKIWVCIDILAAAGDDASQVTQHEADWLTKLVKET